MYPSVPTNTDGYMHKSNTINNGMRRKMLANHYNQIAVVIFNFAQTNRFNESF